MEIDKFVILYNPSLAVARKERKRLGCHCDVRVGHMTRLYGATIILCR